MSEFYCSMPIAMGELLCDQAALYLVEGTAMCRNHARGANQQRRERETRYVVTGTFKKPVKPTARRSVYGGGGKP
jgi:hypothetical protein